MMINKSNFKKHVIDNPNLTLVQFKTEWNGACQIVSMIYDDLAKSYKGVANFYTVDVEKENELDNEYGVSELPTILFFKSGEVIDHAVGLIPKNILISKIENALVNSAN
jgi:thioredoxin